MIKLVSVSIPYYIGYDIPWQHRRSRGLRQGRFRAAPRPPAEVNINIVHELSRVRGQLHPGVLSALRHSSVIQPPPAEHRPRSHRFFPVLRRLVHQKLLVYRKILVIRWFPHFDITLAFSLQIFHQPLAVLRRFVHQKLLVLLKNIGYEVFLTLILLSPTLAFSLQIFPQPLAVQLVQDLINAYSLQSLNFTSHDREINCVGRVNLRRSVDREKYPIQANGG